MSTVVGFFGKIPSRGDFVRQGLPEDFVSKLDAWWQANLTDSRARLGEDWLDIWMEAPVWRFALPPGCCGRGAVIGLWMPSVDKAGRYFPLTIAMVGSSWRDVAPSALFLEAAAEIGLQAVEQDVEPQALAAAIVAAPRDGGILEAPNPGIGRWWTDGSPNVAGRTCLVPEMPMGPRFTAMLTDNPRG